VNARNRFGHPSHLALAISSRFNAGSCLHQNEEAANSQQMELDLLSLSFGQHDRRDLIPILVTTKPEPARGPCMCARDVIDEDRSHANGGIHVLVQTIDAHTMKRLGEIDRGSSFHFTEQCVRRNVNGRDHRPLPGVETCAVVSIPTKDVDPQSTLAIESRLVEEVDRFRR
jgi:hypothetical protein